MLVVRLHYVNILRFSSWCCKWCSYFLKLIMKN